MFTKQNYQLIVTPQMAINVEADVCELISENAFVKHFHVSHQLNSGLHTRQYNKTRCNGFTILVLEENGNYKYQVATCSIKENFSRLKGRYYAYLRAKQEGFVSVPEEAFKYCQDTSFGKERAVIDWFIKTVINKSTKNTNLLHLPGLGNPVSLDEIAKPSFLSVFESLVLSIVDIENVKIVYSYYGQSQTTQAKLVIDKSRILESQAIEEQTKQYDELVSNNLHKAIVKKYAHDKHHKNVGRYYALYKLFNNIVNTH